MRTARLWGEAARHPERPHATPQERKEAVIVARHDVGSTFLRTFSLDDSRWRWGTCERHGGGEPIDDDHDAATKRTVPNGGLSVGGSMVVGAGRLNRGAE